MPAVRVRYQTIEIGDVDIHLRTLRDRQQFDDPDHIAEDLGISSATWPIFGIVWPSGEVLAQFMSDFQVEGKRILEVGCGIGLTSLLLNQRSADITATDYHPEVAGFLRENTRLNNGDAIPFVRVAWDDKEDGRLGKFDLIVGSDLIYEKEHIQMLSDFIDQHAKPDCEVIVVDPGRGFHARFSKLMVKLGYTHSQSQPQYLVDQVPEFSGQVLRYQRKAA